MKKIKTVLFFCTLSYLLLLHSKEAHAVCPVCTVAVGAGLGLSRWLGIDDAVSSIWIGGLILSSSFWLIDWIGKKKNKTLTPNHQLLITILMYALVLVPLWYSKIIGHPLNTILGIDKIIFGTGLGSVMFLFGVWLDKRVRKVYGKQLFKFQKVVFPLLSLVLTSLIVYYYGGYLY